MRRRTQSPAGSVSRRDERIGLSGGDPPSRYHGLLLDGHRRSQRRVTQSTGSKESSQVRRDGDRSHRAVVLLPRMPGEEDGITLLSNLLSAKPTECGQSGADEKKRGGFRNRREADVPRTIHAARCKISHTESLQAGVHAVEVGKLDREGAT